MSNLVVVATIKAKPGKEKVLRVLLQSLIAPTRVEAGCVRYELNEAESDGGWIFVEQWESRALWERHMESPHLAGFKAASEEMVSHFELFVGAQLHPGV